MKLSEIISAVEDFAPLSFQEQWDNSGLVYGDPEMEIRGAVIGFDCTEELVLEAKAKGANMVITHHPLIFRGIKKFDKSDPVSRALTAAIKNDIAVYAAHTNADKVMTGVSGAMADLLDLRDRRFLAPDGDCSGLGIIGVLPKPEFPEDLVSKVKKTFGCKVVRCSRPVRDMISVVALCGGAGSSFIETARLAGAQAYITGDLSYHDFYTHDGFMVMDIGHYEGEVPIVEILFSVIKKKFPNFAVYIAETKRNPVYYL